MISDCLQRLFKSLRIAFLLFAGVINQISKNNRTEARYGLSFFSFAGKRCCKTPRNHPDQAGAVVWKNTKLLIELGFVFRTLGRKMKKGAKRFLMFIEKWKL